MRPRRSACRPTRIAALHAGVDGIYLYNLFNHFSFGDSIWRELGMSSELAFLDKDYFASVLGKGAAAGGALSHETYLCVPQLNPRQPLALFPGTPQLLVFHIGDAFGQGEPAQKATVRLRLQFQPAIATQYLVAKVNDTVISDGVPEGNWLAYPVSPSVLKSGANQVAIVLNASGKPVNWTDLHCTVRYAR